MCQSDTDLAVVQNIENWYNIITYLLIAEWING